MHGDQDEIENNKHAQSDGDIRKRYESEFKEDEYGEEEYREEEYREEEFEQSEDQENNDDPKEIQELNDFIGRFPDFFDKQYITEDKWITFDGLYSAINGEKVRQIINYSINEKTQSKDIKYLKMLQACAVCKVLDEGCGLQCDLCIIRDCNNDANIFAQKAKEIVLDREKVFTAYWFPSKKLRFDLVNNVNDNKYFFVQFNSCKTTEITTHNEDEEEKNMTIPTSMYLAMAFIEQWYDEHNYDKRKDKILQNRFGAIMQYLDYSLRSYQLYERYNNKTIFNDAADLVFKYIVGPCYGLLRMEIFGDDNNTINDVSYRYSILNLVRMYELYIDLHATPTVAVMKYLGDQEYYLGNESVTEDGMKNVLHKYKEDFSDELLLYHGENDNSENNDNKNSDNENNNKEEEEDKSENKFNSFGLNQENEEEKKNAMQPVFKQKIIRKKISKDIDDIHDDSIPEITFNNRKMFKNNNYDDMDEIFGKKGFLRRNKKENKYNFIGGERKDIDTTNKNVIKEAKNEIFKIEKKIDNFAKKSVKNQENSNSVSQDLKDGVKKQSKNGTTKPDVRNANLSPPYSVKKQSVKTTHSPITNNPLPQPQPVNNKPAETNKSGKSNKVKDDSTQKPKEKSQDKKNIKNKTSNVEKNKHKTKKIINTKSELNNEDQKDQTSNAYIYLFIALGVIVVSVIAFFIYRNFVSNVASSESLQNYATNLLSV
jgi:hypothetical protein